MSGAKDFAAALFSLSEELGITERVLLDVEASRQALLDNPEYSSLVDTPAISISEKIELIDKAFADVDEILRNLIKILCEKHSVYIFPAVAKEYRAIYNEVRGICQAEAISAYPLSESHMAALKEKLENTTVIIIAQRIASVKDADRIILLEKGRVCGVGTHDELLENNEVYQDIYSSQMNKGGAE